MRMTSDTAIAPHPFTNRFQKGHKVNVGRTVVITQETKIKMSGAKKGKPLSIAHRLAISAASQKGNKHHFWKGGVASENVKARSSSQLKIWRKTVFERDGYACVECGDARGGNLNADHIKPFAYFPEFRFELNNGRTLCKPCHKKTPTWGHKSNLLYGN